MKILFIQPPICDFYTTPVRFYPLGLAYAAAVARQLGYKAHILDTLTPFKKRQLPIPSEFEYLHAYFEPNDALFKGFYRFGQSTEKILSEIERIDPDLIGISANFTAYYQSVDQLVRAIKSVHDTPVFIGGNHATVFADEIKQRTPQLDAVLQGPAETCLPDFLAEQTGTPQPRQEWRQLQPAHDLLPGSDYKAGRKPTVSITASRGCPFKCEFCSVHAMFGRKLEYRSVEHVLDEMLWNVRHKGTQVFNFEDDNVSFNAAWFQQLLKNIVAEPELAPVELTALNGMCFTTLDGHTLEWMRRAGFYRLNVSLVTQDIRLQKNLHRPTAGSRFEQFVSIAKSLGFFVTVHLIFGLPGQTVEEVKNSVDYLLDLGVLVGPSIFYIPPGSDLYPRLYLPENVRNNWNLYRSSAFALETESINRKQLIDLFVYAREMNLQTKQER